MSISRFKQRYEELKTHLGTDAEGLKRLKALKDAANVIRTSLAAAEAKATDQETAVNEQAKRMRALSRRGEETDAELHRLQQLYSNMERDMRQSLEAASPEVQARQRKAAAKKKLDDITAEVISQAVILVDGPFTQEAERVFAARQAVPALKSRLMVGLMEEAQLVVRCPLRPYADVHWLQGQVFVYEKWFVLMTQDNLPRLVVAMPDGLLSWAAPPQDLILLYTAAAEGVLPALEWKPFAVEPPPATGERPRWHQVIEQLNRDNLGLMVSEFKLFNPDDPGDFRLCYLAFQESPTIFHIIIEGLGCCIKYSATCGDIYTALLLDVEGTVIHTDRFNHVGEPRSLEECRDELLSPENSTSPHCVVTRTPWKEKK